MSRIGVTLKSLAAAWLLAALPALAAPSALGVVKTAKGDVKVTSGSPSATTDVKNATLIYQGSHFQSGADGKAIIRLLPDNAFMEIRPHSDFLLKRVKAKDKRLRRVVIDKGEVVFGMKKKSEPIQCENAQTQATGIKGKFSCKSDEKGVGSYLVSDGEMTIYNRPKDLTVTVRNGQKAVSDVNGIKVSDATDDELEAVGFRQNILEVDFVNPQTEDFSTLEVEYETNF